MVGSLILSWRSIPILGYLGMSGCQGSKRPQTGFIVVSARFSSKCRCWGAACTHVMGSYDVTSVEGSEGSDVWVHSCIT